LDSGGFLSKALALAVESKALILDSLQNETLSFANCNANSKNSEF
jgi:hypothetical protein